MGEPLQLIKFVKDTNSDDKDKTVIELCEDNLAKVLSSTGNDPLCIISICGPSRQGKSFILGHMIRCLTSLENSVTDWMDKENPTKPLTGFQWQASLDPVTKGIWVWSKAFRVKDIDDRTISVILVDTQGTYDEFTTTRDMTAIVGISLLMSSIMLFNFFHNLQEDILNSLSSYVDFGLLALENDAEESMKPFQKLLFLIRDWNNPGNFSYGWDGGENFISKKLEVKPEQPKESQEIREKLEKCFQTIACFLMPTISEKAKQPNYNGNIASLDEAFTENLYHFITRLMTSELVDKTILGNSVTKETFPDYLAQYVKIFNDGDQIPTALSMMEATQFVNNSKVLEKSMKRYQAEVKKQQTSCKYLIHAKLMETHNKAKGEAVKIFKSSKKLGSPKVVKGFEEKLEQQIEDNFQAIQAQNSKTRQAIVEKSQSEACDKYENLLNTEFPFANEYDFHDPTLIRQKSTNFKEICVDDLKAVILEKEGTELDEILQVVDYRCTRHLDKIKTQNEENWDRSKVVMDVTTNEFLDIYKSTIKGISEEDLVETESLFQKRNKVLIEEIMKLFSDRVKPGNASFQQEYQTKLTTSMSSYYNSELLPDFKKKINEMETAGKQLVSQLVDGLKFLLDSEIGKDLAVEELEANVNKICEKRSKLTVEEFKEKSTSPMGTKRRETFETKLESKLRSLCETKQNEAKEITKQMEESYSRAKKEACGFYVEQMTLAKEKLLADEELQVEHEEAFEEALRTYKEIKKQGKTLNEERYRLEFESELRAKFEDIRKETRQLIAQVISRLQNCLNDCIKFYAETMKNQISQFKTDEIMDEADIQARTSTRDKFELDGGLINNPQIKEDFQRKLEEELEKSFGEIAEFTLLKRIEDEARLRTAIDSVSTVYKEEMEKQLQRSTSVLSPQELKQLHRSKSMLAKDIRKDDLSQLADEDINKISQVLEQAFVSFEKENDMKFNSDKTLSDPAIGIDLGTTYCCVAVYYNNKVNIIDNVFGNKTTPSYVQFTKKNGEVVGEVAKDQAAKHFDTTVYDAKRIIGRSMDDPLLQEDMKRWPFSVVDVNGIPKIQIHGKTYHPEEVSAKLLKQLKTEAEKFLKCPISKAVITVPAYFSDGQRRATVDAGELAGLKVLDILNEPTAAAIAYKLQRLEQDARKILIYDLGGGTFDVVVLEIREGNIEVLGVDGDTHLGGEDFDRNLVEHCAKFFKESTKTDLLKGMQSAVKKEKDLARANCRRVQTVCEKVKNQLSSAGTALVNVDNVGKYDLNVDVTRGKFEELNNPLFERTIQIVDRALSSCNVRKEDINDIVLIGGCTKIPKVQDLLSDYFGGKALNVTINPDQAVAYGAAVHAAILNGVEAKKNFNFDEIHDVTAMSYGVDIIDGKFSPIIKRNSKIPSEREKRYTTTTDNQPQLEFCIYQGEDDLVRNNIKLGTFYVTPIPPGKAGQETITVKMFINRMGILQVTATIKSNNEVVQMKVETDNMRLTRKQKEKLKHETELEERSENDEEEDFEDYSGQENIGMYVNDDEGEGMEGDPAEDGIAVYMKHDDDIDDDDFDKYCEVSGDDVSDDEYFWPDA